MKKTVKIRVAYLVRFVDPMAYYDVSYTYKQNGTKVKGIQSIKGCDLTEKQILELFLNEQL